MSELAETAQRIARREHANQTDKAGQPYIGHAERVVAHLTRLFPRATEDEIAAAWLHDVMEDCGLGAWGLERMGIPARVTMIVAEVTRPRSVIYLDWIRSMARHGSLSAVRVKLADNADNSDPARVAAIPGGPEMLRTRYLPARAILEERIARDGPHPHEINAVALGATDS